MILVSPTAQRQIAALQAYYQERQRPQAVRNLAHAVAEAALLIANAPERGLSAPRPYPSLSTVGLLWMKRGRYWIAYDPHVPAIAGIYFDTDDIPNRIGP